MWSLRPSHFSSASDKYCRVAEAWEEAIRPLKSTGSLWVSVCVCAHASEVIDKKKDTIRIYHMGGGMPRVERFGKEGPLTPRDVMIV